MAALLAVGALGVLVAERHRLGSLSNSTLFLRVRTWAIIAPVFLLALFSGGFVVLALAAFIAVQGAREYARLVGLEPRYQSALVLWTLVGLVVAAIARRYFLFLPLGFFVVLVLIPIVRGKVEGAHRQVSGTMFGYLYIGLPMAYLVLIQAARDWGTEFLLILGTAVALSDVTAFIIGKAIGGPRLSPQVSPNKTWAGAGGNVLGAVAAAALMAFAQPADWGPATLWIAAVVVGVGALLGDLTESFVKRDFAVKDAGDLLPGFGGILDRVDSLLLAMPLAYYAVLTAEFFR